MKKEFQMKKRTIFVLLLTVLLCASCGRHVVAHTFPGGGKSEIQPTEDIFVIGASEDSVFSDSIVIGASVDDSTEDFLYISE